MHARPFHAIYLDEKAHTGERCNFPTQQAARLEVCRLIAEYEVVVLAHQQRIGAHAFYGGAERATLDTLETPVRHTCLRAQPDAQRLETSANFAGVDPTAFATLHPLKPRSRD